MTRIAIIAPSLALRAGLRALLSTPGRPASGRLADPVWSGEVAAEAASLAEWATDGDEAGVLVIAAEAFDATLLHAGLRTANKDAEGRLGALVLSDRPGVAQALAALPLHGWGVLPEDVSAEELQAGVQAVAEGLVVGTRRLFGRVLDRLQAESQALAVEAGGFPGGESLTERESQVLQLLARGLPNKQIALALSISEHTVKFHVSSIYAKLGATNRTEAVRNGVHRGLVVL